MNLVAKIQGDLGKFGFSSEQKLKVSRWLSQFDSKKKKDYKPLSRWAQRINYLKILDENNGLLFESLNNPVNQFENGFLCLNQNELRP